MQPPTKTDTSQLVVFRNPLPFMNIAVMNAMAAIPVDAANEYCSP